MATRTPVPQELVNTQPKATEPQKKFIHNLLDQKEMFASTKFAEEHANMRPEELEEVMKAMHERVDTRLTKKDASLWIKQLNKLPFKAKKKESRTADKASTVPDGHYALEYSDDELNPVRFYRVRTGKEGTQWDGYQFVNRFASDDSFPVKGKERYRVLKEIATDPLAAAQRYGREFQRCSICNRGLTRRLSREMGIGPVCAQKVDWVDAAYIEEVRERITSSGGDPDEKMARPRNRQHIINHS